MTELESLRATIEDVRRQGLDVRGISVSRKDWEAVVAQLAKAGEDLIVTDATGGIWFDGERITDDGPSVVFRSLGPAKEAVTDAEQAARERHEALLRRMRRQTYFNMALTEECNAARRRREARQRSGLRGIIRRLLGKLT